MLPMLAWLAAFVVAPCLIMLVYSFCTRDELGQVVFSFTTENYQRLSAAIYLKILWRSAAIAGITTFICFIIGFPAAWFIGTCRGKKRDRLLLLVMIPFWTSFLIRAYAWITILKGEGLLNALLALIHLSPINLLYTPTAVVIGMVYAYLPFMILPIYTSVEKLDETVVEAAMDLGARPFNVFRKIIIPLAKPGIFGGILLVFVPAIGMFAIQDLLGGARVPMIGSVIQNQFGQARDMPFGAALGVMLMVMFILAFCILGRRDDRTA
jgi:spermidine/putrescine transport system permease protein